MPVRKLDIIGTMIPVIIPYFQPHTMPHNRTGMCIGKKMVPDSERAWNAIGSPTPMAVKSPARTSLSVDVFFIQNPSKNKKYHKSHAFLQKANAFVA